MTESSPERHEPTSEIMLSQTEDGREAGSGLLEHETVSLTINRMAK